MKTRWMMGAAAAALTVAGAAVALAADLPTKKEAPAPVFVPPPFTWTGFYIGGNIGGVWGTGTRQSTLYAAGFPFLSTYYPNNLGTNPGGWLLGGQAGYNYQSGAAVFGLETDLDWTSMNRNFHYISPAFAGLVEPFNIYNGDYLALNAKANLDWLGTTRVRVGFVATPDNRLLFYGTGGIAYGGGSANYNLYDAFYGAYWTGNPSSSRVGWTLGAGAEYALTNNWTIKGEYLYYNLGSSRTFAYSNSLFFPGVVATTKYTWDGSIFRIGVNYKF